MLVALGGSQGRRGLTLVEVMVSSTILIVVLLAAGTAFQNFAVQMKDAERKAEALEDVAQLNLLKSADLTGSLLGLKYFRQKTDVNEWVLDESGKPALDKDGKPIVKLKGDNVPCLDDVPNNTLRDGFSPAAYAQLNRLPNGISFYKEEILDGGKRVYLKGPSTQIVEPPRIPILSSDINPEVFYIVNLTHQNDLENVSMIDPRTGGDPVSSKRILARLDVHVYKRNPAVKNSSLICGLPSQVGYQFYRIASRYITLYVTNAAHPEDSRAVTVIGVDTYESKQEFRIDGDICSDLGGTWDGASKNCDLAAGLCSRIGGEPVFDDAGKVVSCNFDEQFCRNYGGVWNPLSSPPCKMGATICAQVGGRVDPSIPGGCDLTPNLRVCAVLGGTYNQALGRCDNLMTESAVCQNLSAFAKWDSATQQCRFNNFANLCAGLGGNPLNHQPANGHVRCDFLANAPANDCRDGVDNDGDNLIDGADTDCATNSNLSESPKGPAPQCSDGIDNDGDLLIDFPADKGCKDALDNWEYGPMQTIAEVHFPQPYETAPWPGPDKRVYFFDTLHRLANPLNGKNQLVGWNLAHRSKNTPKASSWFDDWKTQAWPDEVKAFVPAGATMSAVFMHFGCFQAGVIIQTTTGMSPSIRNNRTLHPNSILCDAVRDDAFATKKYVKIDTTGTFKTGLKFAVERFSVNQAHEIYGIIEGIEYTQ